ncbi:MAG: exosortase family protein XrtF [Flavobacteriaceae bacterium]|nr:exosortase family protein XrtF [Flavobacteriaceae bacterium]
MKALFVKYKSVIRFLALFLGTYLLLSLLYNAYLHFGQSETWYPDPITHLVAKQTSMLTSGFGYQAEITPHPNEASMKLILNDRYLARIVEGCNALSVIALFAAFIVAFHQKWKPTLLYIFVGSVLIYCANLFRIVLLAIALYEYPQYEEVLHGVVFPAIIYGMVFLLWVLWVRRIPANKQQDEQIA